jgi:hypothetical protein
MIPIEANTDPTAKVFACLDIVIAGCLLQVDFDYTVTTQQAKPR